MTAKIAVFFAALAAVHATGLIGYGAPVLAAGHLGTVSAQSTAINHVAPVAPLAYAGALGYGHGIAGAPLGVAGLSVAPLGLGHGLAAGNVRAGGLIGNGIAGSRYGGVIAPNVVAHGFAGGVRHGGLLGLGYGVGLGKAIW